MRALKQYLKTRPEIEDIYFNDKGEWLFCPNDKHPIHKKRDEVMGSVEDIDGDENELSEKAGDVIEALKQENASLTDRITMLELEKEALQMEIEDLKKPSEPTEPQVTTEVTNTATDVDPKKEKTKK